MARAVPCCSRKLCRFGSQHWPDLRQAAAPPGHPANRRKVSSPSLEARAWVFQQCNTTIIPCNRTCHCKSTPATHWNQIPHQDIFYISPPSIDYYFVGSELLSALCLRDPTLVVTCVSSHRYLSLSLFPHHVTASCAFCSYAPARAMLAKSFTPSARLSLGGVAPKRPLALLQPLAYPMLWPRLTHTIPRLAAWCVLGALRGNGSCNSTHSRLELLVAADQARRHHARTGRGVAEAAARRLCVDAFAHHADPELPALGRSGR